MGMDCQLTALDALIEAVEAGTWPEDWREVTRALTLHPDERHIHAKRAFNGSHDAALALHEALLPGWGWSLSAHSGSIGKYTQDAMVDAINPFRCYGANSSTPVRAWLLSILKAYRATLEQIKDMS